MTDRYAVIGNPIEHSKSPLIHSAFARQTKQDITYEKVLAPLDGFADTVDRLRHAGYRGCNVTVPFKFEAFRLSRQTSARAALAQAVNTLIFDGEDIAGDNTDGVGLVRDIRDNLRVELHGKRVLMVGAGGAAFGVLLPLLEELPARFVVCNRTMARAEEAVKVLREILMRGDWPTRPNVEVEAKAFQELGGEVFDVVINATSTGLSGEGLPLPDALYAPGGLAYDMMYGHETPFMAGARRQGARVADGLGMLVEQAAEAFYLWRGVRPLTAPVIAQLRA